MRWIKKSWTHTWLMLSIFLLGCGITTTTFPISKSPNQCQSTEIRRPLSTTVTVVCRDETRVVGVATVPGMALLHAPLEIVKAAAVVGTGVFIFKGAETLADGIQKMKMRHTVDPVSVGVDIEGIPTDFTVGVDGTIDVTGTGFAYPGGMP